MKRVWEDLLWAWDELKWTVLEVLFEDGGLRFVAWVMVLGVAVALVLWWLDV